jgi:hypothetical protein
MTIETDGSLGPQEVVMKVYRVSPSGGTPG